jgi:hypothetical protein
MSPRTRINFDLDQEEKLIINRAAHMSREQLWEILEQKRYDDFKNKAIALQGQMVGQARCPKCTLMPP